MDASPLEEILQGLKDVLIWKSDPGATFTFVNAAAESMLGYPLDRWLGPSAAWTSLIHPEDQKWVKSLCIAETKKSGSFRSEFRLMTASGQVLWVRNYSYLKRTLDGMIEGMYGAMIDITQEKSAAEQTARMEARYRLAAKATRAAVWEWDLKTNELAWMEGISELLLFSTGKEKTDIYFWYDHIHPDDRERIVSGIHTAIDSGGRRWEDEYRFRTGTGSYIVVRDRGQVIRDEENVPIRMIGALVDVTQRKKAEEELYRSHLHEKESLVRARQLLRSQNEILSIVSHDLKNPLSSILMNAALAKKNRSAQESSLQQTVGRIQDAANQMKVVIQDLVDLSRAEAGNLTVDVDEIDSLDLMKESILEAKKSLRRPDVRIEIDPVSEDAVVLGDRERLLPSLVKIIRYLEQIGPTKGNLHLRSVMLGDQMIFSVSHPHLFLKREILSRIFERKGGEVDLAVVRAVVQAHGGHIWVDSLAGKGTSFVFTLNVSRHEQESEAA